MAQYTTGELAKRCNVSVRTVQYYDARGILMPSALSEGGRRLYSDQDVSKLEIICFLRELELPIDSIKGILEEEKPEQVVSLLLQEQEQLLRKEIALKQDKVERIAEAKRALKNLTQVTVESIGDIARLMERRKQLSQLRITMLVLGFLMDAIQVSTLMVWIFTGVWWPFALGVATAVGLGVLVSSLYYRNTVFLCPQCHTIFRPRVRESIFARHTPNTRRLTCPSCRHHGFCVETYGKDLNVC